MVKPPSDRRPPMAIAMQWVSEIITIAMLQVVPLIAGWGLDYYFRTQFVFVAIGAIGGLGLSMQRILTLANRNGERKQQFSPKNRPQ